MLSSWFELWGFVLIGGIVIGLVNWLIGGWWYRMRMYFCGARGVDKTDARLVYMHAQLVWCVPSLVWLVLITPLYPDYHAAYVDSPLTLALVGMVPWSVWVSYRGVRRCFDVRPAWARVWFLILPLIMFGAVVSWLWILSWFGPF